MGKPCESDIGADDEVGDVGVLGLGQRGLGLEQVGLREFHRAGVLLGKIDDRCQGNLRAERRWSEPKRTDNQRRTQERGQPGGARDGDERKKHISDQYLAC